MKTTLQNILIFLLATPMMVQAQNGNKLVRQGNKHYDKAEYKEAEIRYLKSLQTKTDPARGLYNLGDAFYMQGNYLDASAAFDSLRTVNMDDGTRSQTYYNLGNSLLKLAKDSAQMAQEALPSSIESYKQSLRLNPNDMDAKYNLAYAQRMLDQQQQNQDPQQDQQEDQQQQEQQQEQNQQQQDQKEQPQDQQDQQQEQQPPQEQQQQQQAQQISKEDAERMLEALKNDEKQTLEKLKHAQVKAMKKIRTEKDW